jgi:uncharacterized protein (DUF885 family)
MAALVVSAAACSSAPPPAPPPAGSPPAPPDEVVHMRRPKRPGAAVVAAPTKGFAAVRDRIIDELLRDEPSFGRSLGLHEHDGKIADYSADGIAARVARLTKARAELAGVTGSITANDALDLALILGHIDLTLFRLVDLAEHQRRPQFYDELFAVNSYLDREYAPIADRAKALLAHEQASLAQIKHVRANLQSPMSKPIVETAAKIYGGFAKYLRGDVVKLLKGVGDAAFQESFAKTNEALAKEAEALAKHLSTVEAPKGDSSHILGPERYRKLLQVQEGLAIPLAEFKAMGEKNLAINKKAYEEQRPKAKVTRPKASELLAEATRLMDSSRKFVIDKQLVTIPTEEKAILKETPPYKQWNAAFLDPPGPFETAKLNAFYYITLPDKSWKKKEQEEYIMTHGILLATTVHEVYPGHFLQGLWMNAAPTRAQKMFGSYSFIEGWAHYTEQLMVEEGFGAEDPQNRLGQLSDALLRNCRFVVSLGVHTEGMTMADAEKRFMDDCFQDKATAREQAARAAFDPGYFAYTLGKIQILDLREDARKAMGDKFTLKRFHDALLSHGSPAVPIIRARVLEDLSQ